jgi:hypothetical protein
MWGRRARVLTIAVVIAVGFGVGGVAPAHPASSGTIGVPVGDQALTGPYPQFMFPGPDITEFSVQHEGSQIRLTVRLATFSLLPGGVLGGDGNYPTQIKFSADINGDGAADRSFSMTNQFGWPGTQQMPAHGTVPPGTSQNVNGPWTIVAQPSFGCDRASASYDATARTYTATISPWCIDNQRTATFTATFDSGSKVALHFIGPGQSLPGGTYTSIDATGSVTVTAPPPPSGYWMVGRDGAVYSFGDVPFAGAASGIGEVVDIEPTPTGRGYTVLTANGQVKGFGDSISNSMQGTSGFAADERFTSLSIAPNGRGEWLFTNKGRVVAQGLPHFGDLRTMRLNAPIVDSIATPSGNGYYMVAADGGVFAFGDARFYGSMGGTRLNAPVMSLVPDPDGVGYWLVAFDGGVFAFQAPFMGSMGSTRLNRPVTGMVPFGNGYLMVAEDGGIFNFSNRAFAGSLGGQRLSAPIVAVAAP